MSNFSPMLSSNFDIKRDYGQQSWLISKKIDGIRCYITTGPEGSYRVHTRSGKAVPNGYIRRLLSLLPDGFDGELAPKVLTKSSFQEATSIVMTHNGEPDFCYHVFNYFGDGSPEFCAKPLTARLNLARSILADCIAIYPELEGKVYILDYTPVTLEEAFEYAAQDVLEGGEGAILTHTNAPYLMRRSRPTEPHSLKLKPFSSVEARIVGFEEAKNKKGELKGELGSLLLNSDEFSEDFNCGTGFTSAIRKEIWANQLTYLGKYVTIAYVKSGSKASRPRMPVYKGLRDAADMSPMRAIQAEISEALYSRHIPTLPTLENWANSPEGLHSKVQKHINYWRQKDAFLRKDI